MGTPATNSYRYPEKEAILEMVDGIWDRQYYTNHGPLSIKLEEEVQRHLKVGHAVAMTNPNIALLITLLALNPQRATIPACLPSYVPHSLNRMGIGAEIYQSAEGMPLGNPGSIENAPDHALLIGCHACGMSADVEALAGMASNTKSDLLLISDNHWKSYQELARGRTRIIEIQALDQTQIVNGVEGACVLTDDDELAAQLRNIRSSYGAGRVVEIPYTGNGRISEIQSGMALLSLERIEKSRFENQGLGEILCEKAAELGVEIIDDEAYRDGYLTARGGDAASWKLFLDHARQNGLHPAEDHYAAATLVENEGWTYAIFNLNEGRSKD